MAPKGQATSPWFSPLEGESRAFLDCAVNALEHSIDILSCHDNKFNVAATIQNPCAPPIPIEYDRRHDEFLESLLQEQQRLQKEGRPRPLSLSSSSSTIGDSSEPCEAPKQKRRPVKLSRRSTAKKSPLRTGRKVLPIQEASDELSESFTPKVDDDESSLVTRLTMRQLPDPPWFMHPDCRMQKDKGKGETLGSDVCATGKDACLEKLRQKMELLTQVAMGGEDKKKGASMKRLKAKVTEETAVMVETRSVIDLKMGFLSMRYGVLLQWNRCGLVTMCVLRKMCSESFMKKELMKSVRKSIPRESYPIVLKTESSSHVILQRWENTEVTLLEPPFRVDRPLSFEPAVLSVTILKLEGFDERSIFTVHLGLEGLYHKSRCQFQGDHIRPVMDRPMEWRLNSDFEISIDVIVYEQKRARHKRKKLISKEAVALNLLDGCRVAQNRLLVQTIKQLGAIHFNILLQSDYCQWLYQELDARRREEDWKAPFYPVYIEEPQPEPEDHFLWGLCCT